MKRVSLDSAEYAEILEFCKKIQEKQNKVGSRDFHNNDTGSNRLYNGMVGKVGECAATKLVGGIIDLNVWDTGTRGIDQFEADIIGTDDKPLLAPFDGMNIHVKTCALKHAKMDVDGEIVPEQSASWTIDIKDPLMKNPSDKDILVLMFAEEFKGKAFALGWVKAKDVVTWWRRCLSAHMGHKRAIYYPDIKQLINLF